MEILLRLLSTAILQICMLTTLHCINATYHNSVDDNISNRNYNNVTKLVTNSTKEKIKIGVLLPYTIGKAKISAYFSGSYYASAMYLALDDINNNKHLLPNHELELVWGDTECDKQQAIKLQKQMMVNENVDAFIGGSCEACITLTKTAKDKNLPMVSHRCIEPELSRKDLYPTFARTERIGHQLFPAIRELLNYFKWQKIALIVENSRMYKLNYKDLQRQFHNQIIDTKWIGTPSKYAYDKHYQQVVDDMRYLSTRARIIVLMMSIRVAKECLIAAAELNMVDGNYVFIAFEVDINGGEARQESPFSWATADYVTTTLQSENSFSSFIERSKNLCMGWEATLLMMIKRSGGLSEQHSNEKKVDFNDRVRKGMKIFFNSKVYEGKISGTNHSKSVSKPPRYAQNLYDAIMLYAIAVNDTLKKGGNYKDGKAVIQNVENKVFYSAEGYEYFFNNNSDIQFPFTLFHYGKQPSRVDCACNLQTISHNMAKCENSFPKMEPMAEIDLKETNMSKNVNGALEQETYLKFQYIPIPNAHVYWPGNVDLNHIKDEPECGFAGNLCKKEGKDRNIILIAVVSFVCLVSIIIAAFLYRKYKSNEGLNCSTYNIKDRMLLVPDEDEIQL